MRHDAGNEVGEGTGLLRDADRQKGLLALAEGGALSDEAQSVKVHVGARGDGHHGLPAIARVLGHVFLEAGDGEGACGLETGAGVVVHVLDSRADLVGGDLDNLVNDVLAEAERLLADGLDGGTVCKEADAVQDHSLSLGQGLDQRIGVVGLDTNDLDMGRHALHVDTDSGDETTTSDAAEDGIELGHVDLTKQLHTNGSLARNDVRVVKGRNVDQTVLRRSSATLLLGGIEIGTVQHDMSTQARDVEVLDTGCGFGHDNGGGDLELAGRVGDALSVVAGGAADDALPADGRVEVGHLVVGAAQLEAEDGLLVLALEENIALESVAEVDGGLERCDFTGFVDAGRCGGDHSEVLKAHKMFS